MSVREIIGILHFHCKQHVFAKDSGIVGANYRIQLSTIMTNTSSLNKRHEYHLLTLDTNVEENFRYHYISVFDNQT